MAPQHDIVLGLVLCLAQLCSWTHEELHPKPNISAQPGPKVPLGQSVTIVCKAPLKAKTFRMEKTHRGDGIKEGYTLCDSLDQNCGSPDQTPINCGYVDQTNVSRDGSDQTNAEFHIKKLCKRSAGSYRCLYHTESQWSKFSDTLVLVVTSEDDSDPNSDEDMPDTPWVYIIIGISVTVFVLLLLLLLLLVHLRRRRREHGSTSGKLKKQRPQDRVTPAAEVHTGTPEPLATLPSPATVDGPPLLGVAGSPMTTAAETPSEVTYAQLNPNSLLHAVPTQPEPSSESCTYASVVRH